jgi:poly-gamma-glutamate synthesis protein (capsule biosynthesis protein)
VANLETAVTRRGAPASKGIHYRMHPGNVGCLAAAPVDCWTLANNHVLDWGRVGLEDTLDVLEENGLRSAGAGRDRARAEAPAVVPLPGDGRVLVFARGSVTSGIPWSWAAERDAPGVSLLEGAPVDRIAARVEAVRRAGDLVVASIHWGGNWGYEIPAAEREIAHALVDEAGVDVVHGHSSHHPKAIEVYRGKPILYGCGDFLNDYEGIGGYASYRAELVLLYFATFERGSASLARLEMSPFRLARLRLNDASPDETRWLRETLDRECRELGTRVEAGEDGRLALRF